ncbi:hypothetical protein [Microtetraspora malaysiensis]|uniref:hypothetical protein n=1 Tax=Microtetraspora malaysiensis TaxID=161358 RepID=UPI003D8CEF68
MNIRHPQNEKASKARVRTTLRSSYSSYYRQMLPPLLRTLGFKCSNTAYRPAMDALTLLEKYADVDGKTRFYDACDAVPMDGIVRKDWREAVIDDKGRIEHNPVRAVRPGGAAGRDPAPRDLRRRRPAVAQP